MVLLRQVTQAAEALSATNKARHKVSISYKTYRQRKEDNTNPLEDPDNPPTEILVSECRQEWSRLWAVVKANVAAFNTAAVLLTPTALIRGGGLTGNTPIQPEPFP